MDPVAPGGGGVNVEVIRREAETIARYAERIEKMDATGHVAAIGYAARHILAMLDEDVEARRAREYRDENSLYAQKLASYQWHATSPGRTSFTILKPEKDST